MQKVKFDFVLQKHLFSNYTTSRHVKNYEIPWYTSSLTSILLKLPFQGSHKIFLAQHERLKDGN